jgi:putative transposase
MSIAKKIIDIAVQNACGIKMEQLDGIRGNRKQAKSFRYSLHSWSFYQLQTFIEYKAKLNGVTVTYVDPAYTSQQCSRCGLIGNRSDKSFSCPSCGHVDHADANASFNIALRPPLVEGSGRFRPDRDVRKGRIDTPQEAPA